MPNTERFDLDFFKPKTKEDKKSLAKTGYFELKERALDYLKSHRQALPNGLNLDEVSFLFKSGIVSLVYAGRYAGIEINDVGILFKTDDSTNGALIPLGIGKGGHPYNEATIAEILRKYELPIQVQKWKSRCNKK